MQPSIGRIVHYVSYGTPGGEFHKACRAAIVTELGVPVPTGTTEADPRLVVGLAILNPTGMFFNRGVHYDEWDSTTAIEGAEAQGGSWHWPERI